MEFEVNQEIEITEGKFIITSVETTPQGFYNIRFCNVKDKKPWIRGKSVLEIMIKKFEEEKLNKEKEKEEKRKARRKEKFIKKIEVAEIVDPYIGEGATKIQKIQYYKSVGYLARHAEMDAYVADKVRDWFDEQFYLVKGKYPDGPGYYPHGKEVDKWASELRLKFNVPEDKTSQDIVFGPYVKPVLGSGHDFYINNNDLCWYLLSLGFDLGKKHDVKKIESHIPADYVKYFERGL